MARLYADKSDLWADTSDQQLAPNQSVGLCPMPEAPSHTDPTSQPPCGICSTCYEAWRAKSPNATAGTIYCQHNQAGAVLQKGLRWVVVQPASAGEFTMGLANGMIPNL